MKVKIFNIRSGTLSKAVIRRGEKEELPSIQDNWIFNFKKKSNLPNSFTYVLVNEGRFKVIEGCMIFSLHKTFGPFMNYLEVAPHNKGINRRYKYVAGCLIAYACGLSFEFGNKEEKGILTFLAAGKTSESSKLLERLYRDKYGAKKNPFGYMEIYQEQSKVLMDKYLYRV